MFQSWAEFSPPRPRYSYGCADESPISARPSLPYPELASIAGNSRTHTSDILTHGPRQRTSQACEKCRDRKTKCSGGRPVCQRCATRGLLCQYPSREKRPSKARSRLTSDGPSLKRGPSHVPHKLKVIATPQPPSRIGPPLGTFPRYPYYPVDGVHDISPIHGYPTPFPEMPSMYIVPEPIPFTDGIPHNIFPDQWVQVPPSYYDHGQQLYHSWDFVDRSNSPSYLGSQQSASDVSSDNGATSHSGTYLGSRDPFYDGHATTMSAFDSYDSSSPSSSNTSSPSPGGWPSEPEAAVQLAELELAYRCVTSRLSGQFPQPSPDQDFRFEPMLYPTNT